MAKRKLQYLHPANGAAIGVSTQARYPFVELESRDDDGGILSRSDLTPNQARQLAIWLERAACRAELAAPEKKVR